METEKLFVVVLALEQMYFNSLRDKQGRGVMLVTKHSENIYTNIMQSPPSFTNLKFSEK